MNEKELQDKIAILEQTIKTLQELVSIKDQTIIALKAQPTVQITQPGLLPYYPASPHIIVTPAFQPIQAPYPPYTVTCGDIAIQSGGTYETQPSIAGQVGSGYGGTGGCASSGLSFSITQGGGSANGPSFSITQGGGSGAIVHMTAEQLALIAKGGSTNGAVNHCVSCRQTPEQMGTYGVWCNDHNPGSIAKCQ